MYGQTNSNKTDRQAETKTETKRTPTPNGFNTHSGIVSDKPVRTYSTQSLLNVVMAFSSLART